MIKFAIVCFILSLEIVAIFGTETLCFSNKVCICSKKARKNIVKCGDVANIKDVEDFFGKNQNFTPVSFLNIEKCQTRSLPNSIFWNTTIKEIRSPCPFDKMENDALSTIQNLKHLDLRKTEFSRIPIAISKLVELKTLHITEGKLTRIDTELKGMSGLSEIKMSRNPLSEISRDAFSENFNLKAIDLSENKLIFLHPGLFDGCQKLTKILLQKNSINSADGLFNSSNLQKIHLEKNNLRSIDDAFKQKMNLEILHLDSNPLMQIGNSAFNANVKELRTLTLSSCQLSFLLPTVFWSLTKLEFLDLSSNRLESLPVEIFHGLSNLLIVNLKENQISYLGEVFRQNYGLESIIISQNHLQTVENVFRGLRNLTIVDLKLNKLKVISEADFLTTRSMRFLHLSNNSICRIDSNAFLHMVKLKYLSLDSNHLTTLNGSLRNSRKLEILKLHHNQLKEIGRSEMSNLRKLQRLDLSFNNLTNVYKAFQKLVQLSSLNLNNNKLLTVHRKTFPLTIKIKEIFAAVNPWICDCRLLWLLKYSELFGRFQCTSPKKFQKKNVNQLTSHDLTNWSDNCDNSCECTCIQRDNELSVRVNCSGRNKTKIPDVLPEEVGELHLQNNLLSNLDDLNKHSLPRLRYLDVEQNFLTNIDFYLPKSLRELKLAGNNLTRFMSYLPLSVVSLTLSSNPWICDCDMVQFWKFLTSKKKTKILDVKSMTCSQKEGLPDLYGKHIRDLTENELCPEKSRLYIFIGVGLSVLVLTAIGCHLVYTRYRYHIKVWLYSRGFSWLKKTDNRDSEKMHDAYMCFSVQDLDFVQEHILPELEDREPFYSLFVPPRDLRVGRFKLDQQLEEVRKSKRIIIIVSQNFIDNEVCMEIFRVAFISGLEEKHYRIIPIVVGTLPPMSDLDPSLKVALQSTKTLKFGQKLLWEMVRFAMPEKSHMADATGSDNDIDMPLLNAF